MKNTTVLVTGGAGVIGSSLCKALLGLNTKVICFDDFSTGSLDAIASFRNHPYFKLIGGTIQDIEKCKKVVDGVDYVFHLAKTDTHSAIKSDAFTINDTTVVGFLNMLSVTQASNVKGFIYPVSCSQSSDSLEIPKIEEVMYGKSLSKDIISKYTKELYANLFRREYGLQIKGVAFTSIFDKTEAVAVSKIVQLNIDVLQGMLREAYQPA